MQWSGVPGVKRSAGRGWVLADSESVHLGGAFRHLGASTWPAVCPRRGHGSKWKRPPADWGSAGARTGGRERQAALQPPARRPPPPTTRAAPLEGRAGAELAAGAATSAAEGSGGGWCCNEEECSPGEVPAHQRDGMRAPQAEKRPQDGRFLERSKPPRPERSATTRTQWNGTQRTTTARGARRGIINRGVPLMSGITGAFQALAWIMVVLLLIGIGGVVAYLRWKAKGQERGF